jgi:hypothetical protein
MTAMLILNGVFMVMIVAAILAVCVWGIATDKPWRDYVRLVHTRRAPRPARTERYRRPARQRAAEPRLSS